MSLRPPATYFERYTDNSGATNADGRTPWPQANGSPTALWVAARAGNGGPLALRSITFENAGTLVSTPSAGPAGKVLTNVSIPIPAPADYDIVPATIDPSTTALPFTLWFGPLGPGGR